MFSALNNDECAEVVTCKSLSSDCFLSDVMLAIIEIVLIWISRNVRQVVRPSASDGLYWSINFITKC